MTEQIGRFHIRKRLGGGGFGEVFLAEDPTIGRQVAIKVFSPKDENLIAFATSSNTEGLDVLRTRFLNEAKILARLENATYVVNVLDYGELPNGSPYYVMPYLPHSLADELGKDVFDVQALADLPDNQHPRSLPVDRCLRIGEQLIEGLAAAHQNGLVHRDVKPGNVMLTEDGDVRVVDFGIAKAPDVQHSTVSQLGMGSRNYMAPEQRESAKHVDARADVYAVGRVIYRMLTGKLPVGRFADPNVAVPSLGQAMNDVILAAISEDRSERPANAVELLKRYRQALGSVGQQDTSEHSGTWVGEQGLSGLRDELKPLKARIIATIEQYGFISNADRRSLSALAMVADLDDAGLDTLIEQTVSADKRLSARGKLGALIRAQVAKVSGALSDDVLGSLHAAAEAVGWDHAELRAAMQHAVADLPAAPPLKAAEPPPAAASGVPPQPAVSGRERRARETGTGKGWGLSSSKLVAAAAIVVLALGAWGVYAWRQSQLAEQAREHAISVAADAETAAWTAAGVKDTEAAYIDYLDKYPNGRFAGEVQQRVAEARRKAAAVAKQETAPARPRTGSPISATDDCEGDSPLPQSPEEKILVESGQRFLTGRALRVSPYGQYYVVEAVTAFGGQCRPSAFNVYVFKDNKMMGTLSRHAMASRTDGAIVDFTPAGDHRIEVKIARYGPDDPLCCPGSYDLKVFDLETMSWESSG